jgi:hypothetical protein
MEAGGGVENLADVVVAMDAGQERGRFRVLEAVELAPDPGRGGAKLLGHLALGELEHSRQLLLGLATPRSQVA